MKIYEKYFVTTERKTRGKGYWDHQIVSIHQRQENGESHKVGEYTRNYPGHAESTFCPFKQDDKEFALVSDHYTRTRVISLPDCKVVVEQPVDGCGFCPVEFVVPIHEELYEETGYDSINGQFGLVDGCYWGGDYHVRFIDLSRIQQGELIIDDRLGGLSLVDSMKLKDAISLEWWDNDPEDTSRVIQVACKKEFDLDKIEVEK